MYFTFIWITAQVGEQLHLSCYYCSLLLHKVLFPNKPVPLPQLFNHCNRDQDETFTECSKLKQLNPRCPKWWVLCGMSVPQASYSVSHAFPGPSSVALPKIFNCSNILNIKLCFFHDINKIEIGSSVEHFIVLNLCTLIKCNPNFDVHTNLTGCKWRHEQNEGGGILLKAWQEVKHNFFQLGIRCFRDLAISPRTEQLIYLFFSEKVVALKYLRQFMS